MDWVPVALVERDQEVNTRPVDEHWVAQTVPDFDAEAIGNPTVSHRANGQFIVLDGQKRFALLRQVGWGDQSILCRVYEGLNKKQEARLFRLLNNAKAVKTIYRFFARQTEEEPCAMAITEILANHGWKISEGAGPGIINAVGALDRIYRDGKEPGPDALTKTIFTVTTAWGHKPEGVQRDVLIGISQLHARYGDEVDQEDLIKKLAGYPGGPVELLGAARGLRQYERGTVSHSLFLVLVKLYNERKRTRKLV